MFGNGFQWQFQFFRNKKVTKFVCAKLLPVFLFFFTREFIYDVRDNLKGFGQGVEAFLGGLMKNWCSL